MKQFIKNQLLILFVFLSVISSAVKAENATVYGVGIARVAVNAGADSANPGVSCIMLDVPVATQCKAGYIAIPNNNADLIKTALVAKSSKAKIWAYYEVDRPLPEGHCPGLAFTPCVLNSLMLLPD